jgi:hypothetical protein
MCAKIITRQDWVDVTSGKSIGSRTFISNRHKMHPYKLLCAERLKTRLASHDWIRDCDGELAHWITVMQRIARCFVLFANKA